LISVYTAESMVDAQLVCDALITEGLEATISGGYLSGAIGELPTSTLISVWITDQSQIARARRVVAAFEQRFLSRGSAGRGLRPCPKCTEPIESQFDHCWQCGASLVE